MPALGRAGLLGSRGRVERGDGPGPAHPPPPAAPPRRRLGGDARRPARGRRRVPQGCRRLAGAAARRSALPELRLLPDRHGPHPAGDRQADRQRCGKGPRLRAADLPERDRGRRPSEDRDVRGRGGARALRPRRPPDGLLRPGPGRPGPAQPDVHGGVRRRGGSGERVGGLPPSTRSGRRCATTPATPTSSPSSTRPCSGRPTTRRSSPPRDLRQPGSRGI